MADKPDQGQGLKMEWRPGSLRKLQAGVLLNEPGIHLFPGYDQGAVMLPQHQLFRQGDTW